MPGSQKKTSITSVSYLVGHFHVKNQKRRIFATVQPHCYKTTIQPLQTSQTSVSTFSQYFIPVAVWKNESALFYSWFSVEKGEHAREFTAPLFLAQCFNHCVLQSLYNLNGTLDFNSRNLRNVKILYIKCLYSKKCHKKQVCIKCKHTI